MLGSGNFIEQRASLLPPFTGLEPESSARALAKLRDVISTFSSLDQLAKMMSSSVAHQDAGRMSKRTDRPTISLLSLHAWMYAWKFIAIVTRLV